MPIIDIHTHRAPRPTSDRFGVAVVVTAVLPPSLDDDPPLLKRTGA